MTPAVDFAPFLMGMVIGVVLSAALAARGVALWAAALASVAITYLFAEGGQQALVETAGRLGGHLKEASDTGLIGGVLAGKMAAAVLRGVRKRD